MPLHSLFVLRHAQRADKVASTVSSIEIGYNYGGGGDDGGGGIGGEFCDGFDVYNPGLATFASTRGKSNNGVSQSNVLGAKLFNYLNDHVRCDNGGCVRLRLHTSPYVRCLETVKYMLDFLVKQEIRWPVECTVSVDHVLSEWLNTDLDINHFPPNDNGETLMNTAIQYLHSNLPFNANSMVSLRLDLTDPYRHGNPGAFSESFIHQYSRLSHGLASMVKSCVRDQQDGQNDNEILILMTHGACVRSLVSKLMGKSLFVEIPLGSATLARPVEMKGSLFYWRLVETDIPFRGSRDFKPVDLYSHRDPFQDVQTTFNHQKQLDFKSSMVVPASKTGNFNRLRSQSLLNSKVKTDSDSDSDTDDEGLSFSVGRRSMSPDFMDIHRHRRFRSSSLFGDKNPADQLRQQNTQVSSVYSKKNSFERTKRLLKEEKEQLDRPRRTVAITPVASSNNLASMMQQSHRNEHKYSWSNIDIDDGKYTDSGTTVPDLEEFFSSNNSSANSLVMKDDGLNNLKADSLELKGDGIETMNNGSTATLIQDSDNNNLFDKELIERSLKEHKSTELSKPDMKSPSPSDWVMNFSGKKDSHLKMNIPNDSVPKFKVDLYGKKNRNNLNTLSLYDNDDDYEEESSTGWFLGSNRY